MRKGPSFIAFLLVTTTAATAGAGPRGGRPQRARPAQTRSSLPPPSQAELMRSIDSVRAHHSARQTVYFRTEIMTAQMARGDLPAPQLVGDSPRADLGEVRAPRGQRLANPTYRVSYLRGATLDLFALLPRQDGRGSFALRVHHPDGTVESLPPIAATGPVTAAPLRLRLRPGKTTIEIDRGRRIDLHWDGRDRLP